MKTNLSKKQSIAYKMPALNLQSE